MKRKINPQMILDQKCKKNMHEEFLKVIWEEIIWQKCLSHTGKHT